jgi:hypothetical protein
VEVFVNDLLIQANQLEHEQIEKNGRQSHLVRLQFHVKSEDSHRVTTTLYENDFTVRIPTKNLEFQAVIHNYYTSIADLHVEGAVADFSLELIEK